MSSKQKCAEMNYRTAKLYVVKQKCAVEEVSHDCSLLATTLAY